MAGSFPMGLPVSTGASERGMRSSARGKKGSSSIQHPSQLGTDLVEVAFLAVIAHARRSIRQCFPLSINKDFRTITKRDLETIRFSLWVAERELSRMFEVAGAG